MSNFAFCCSHASKAIRLFLSLTLVLASLPVHSGNLLAQSVNQADKPVQSRATPPHKDLPNLQDVLDEGKGLKQTKAKETPRQESTLCGLRDVICQEAKLGKKFSANVAPVNDSNKAQVAQAAKPAGSSWLRRLGRGLSNALTAVASGKTGATTAMGNSFLPKTSAAAPPPPPWSFSSLQEAKLDAYYRLGTGGEDLFSGNYH